MSLIHAFEQLEQRKKVAREKWEEEKAIKAEEDAKKALKNEELNSLITPNKSPQKKKTTAERIREAEINAQDEMYLSHIKEVEKRNQEDQTNTINQNVANAFDTEKSVTIDDVKEINTPPISEQFEYEREAYISHRLNDSKNDDGSYSYKEKITDPWGLYDSHGEWKWDKWEEENKPDPNQAVWVKVEHHKAQEEKLKAIYAQEFNNEVRMGLGDSEGERAGVRVARKFVNSLTLGWIDPYAEHLPSESGIESAATVGAQVGGMLLSFEAGFAKLGLLAVKSIASTGRFLMASEKVAKGVGVFNNAMKSNKVTKVTSDVAAKLAPGVTSNIVSFSAHGQAQQKLIATPEQRGEVFKHSVSSGAIFGTIGKLSEGIKTLAPATGKYLDKTLFTTKKHQMDWGTILDSGMIGATIFSMGYDPENNAHNPHHLNDVLVESIAFTIMHGRAASGERWKKDSIAAINDKGNPRYKENALDLIQEVSKLKENDGVKITREQAEVVYESINGEIGRLEPEQLLKATKQINEIRQQIKVQDHERQFITEVRQGKKFNIDVTENNKGEFIVSVKDSHGTEVHQRTSETMDGANLIRDSIAKDLEKISSESKVENNIKTDENTAVKDIIKDIEANVKNKDLTPEQLREKIEDIKHGLNNETPFVSDVNSGEYISISSSAKNKALKKIEQLEKRLVDEEAPAEVKTKEEPVVKEEVKQVEETIVEEPVTINETSPMKDVIKEYKRIKGENPDIKLNGRKKVDYIEAINKAKEIKPIKEEKVPEEVVEDKKVTIDKPVETMTHEEFTDHIHENIHKAQSDAELKMMELQRANTSEAYHYIAEHIGDLLQRMTKKNQPFAGHEYVEQKVNMILSNVHSQKQFENEVSSQLKTKAKIKGTSVGEVTNTLNKLADIYADAHSKLPVYNNVQKAARDAAVAFGKRDYKSAIKHLKELKKYVDKGYDSFTQEALKRTFEKPTKKQSSEKHIEERADTIIGMLGAKESSTSMEALRLSEPYKNIKRAYDKLKEQNPKLKATGKSKQDLLHAIEREVRNKNKQKKEPKFDSTRIKEFLKMEETEASQLDNSHIDIKDVKKTFLELQKKNPNLKSNGDTKLDLLQAIEREVLGQTKKQYEQTLKSRDASNSPQSMTDKYFNKFEEVRRKNPEKFWAVDKPERKEILEAAEDGRLIDTGDGFGYVTKDGDMKGLFKYNKNAKGVAKAIQEARIELGGIKTDNFDGKLTTLYEQQGLRVVARIPFNKKYAPEGWVESRDGTPDVVAMILDPQKKLDIKVKTFKDYDKALKYRDSFVHEARANLKRDGQQNAKFFTEKATNLSSDVPYEPHLTQVDQNSSHAKSYKKYTEGKDIKFTEHISKMIAGFKEKQISIVKAVTEGKFGSFLDIGGSEGGLAKAIGSQNKNMRVTVVDPNPQMQRNFNSTGKVKNVEYKLEALGSEWVEPTGEKINRFTSDKKYDIINEDFTFQFISNNRAEQVKLVKEHLNEDGIFITSEKFFTENFKANEKRKLDYQRKYFEEKDLTEDKQTIISGMAKDMVKDVDYVKILKKNFKHVEEFWNAGNFKGYIASNNKAKLKAFKESLGDLSGSQTDGVRGKEPLNKAIDYENTLGGLVESRYGKRSVELEERLQKEYNVDTVEELTPEQKADFQMALKWERQIETDKKFLKGEGQTVDVGASPFTPNNVEMLKAMTRVGADYIIRGAKTLKAFSEKMISHVGEGIKPHVRKLFKYVKDYLKNPKIGLGIEVVEDGVTKILQDGEPTGFFITAGDFMARNLKGERYPFGVRSAEVYGSFSLGKTPTTKLLKAAKKGMRVVAIGGYTGIEGSMKDNISFHKGVLSTVKERLGVRVLDKLIKKHGYSKEEQLNNDSQKSLSGILADANKIIKERNDSGTGKPLKRIIKKDIALNFVEPDVLNLLGRINYIGILKEVRTGDARNYKHDIYVTEPIFEKIIELENKPYLRDLIAELPDATFNKGLSRKEWGKAISQGDLTVARGDSPLGDLLLKAAIEGGTGFKRNIEAPVQIYSESLKKRNITEAIEDLSSERGFRLRKASVELDGALGLQNLSRETIHINGEVGNGVVTEYIHTPETATALKLKGAMLSLLGKQPDVTTFIGKDKGNHSLYKLTTINKDVKGIAEALNTVGVKDFIITRRGLETDVTIKDYGEVNIDAVNNLAKILDANYSKAEGEFVELFGTNNQKHLKGKKQGEFFNEKEKSRFAHERAIEIIASQPEGWKIAKKIFTKNLSDFTGGKKVEIKRADELLNDIKLKRKTLSKAEGDKLAHGIETEGGRALDRLIEGGSMGTKNFYGRETSNYSRKQKFEDATKVAVAVLHKGAKNFQVFAKEMISKLGKSVKPLLNKLYGEAKKYLKNPKIGLGIEVVDKDGTPINKNKIGEDVTIWGDRYTETGEPLPKSELIKKKKKLNGAIHITEAGLKSNKIATDADFKRMKKELFGETTLKNILNSSDASSYLQMKAYHELLGRYSNRAVTVKLGGKEVTLSDLTRTPKVEEVPDPLSVVTKEMGVDIPEGSKVDISRSELTDVDLIADANMSKPRKTPKVPGSPTGKGAWVTIKRFLRNISSTEDWMSHIQQQHGVKTFDVWERIRQGQAQFEAKRGEWTGKLQNALEPFGKTKNWNDWFPQEDRMRVHEALVGKIDPSTLKPHEAAAYKVLHEYYNDPVMKKAYRTMRFMDWYQNASGNLKGVAPDVIQLTNGELVWGRIKKGKDSDSFVEINIGDGKDPNILKVKKKDIADDGVGSTLDRLAKILEKEHESGSTTFDLFHKELENTPGFLVSKNYAPEFSADTKLGFNVPMKEMSKGFLKSKQDGETSVRFDALNNFTRKVTADLKFMFLKNPVREMKDIYESGRLSQEANIEIAQTIDYLDRPFDASSLTAFERHLVGNIMKVSLTTLKAWTRNSLQRWTAMPYYSVADMPSFLLNTAKMTFNRGGMFNARKSSSFKKAPNKLKKYFLELVTNDHVLQEEFLHRYHTPWLDKGGIAGRFAKKAMDLYTGVDTTNRWVNFKNAYDVVSKHLNSNKSFGKIRKKIFWDFLPESLKDNLRHEIEAGNTDYVAMKIAESMTGRKWQYRYGRLERSMHEKSHKGAWFGRVTNYSRNYMLRNLDAGKRIFDGTTGMVKTIGRDHAQFKLHRQKTLQSTKELIGLYLVSSMLEETFKGITGKRGITGWNPINAMMGEIYPFVDTLSDLGTPLASLGSVSISLSHYLAGDMSKKEWEKSWQRDLRATIRAVDTMSLQQIMFYKWFVVGGLEIIYGKNGIKPLSDAINKGLNPEKWGRENVDRTELEMAQHLAFGKDYIESTRSYLKKKEKPVF